MAHDPLKGLKVAILVTDGFEEVELTKPRQDLDEAAAATKIVSPKIQYVRAWHLTDWSVAFGRSAARSGVARAPALHAAAA